MIITKISLNFSINEVTGIMDSKIKRKWGGKCSEISRRLSVDCEGAKMKLPKETLHELDNSRSLFSLSSLVSDNLRRRWLKLNYKILCIVDARQASKAVQADIVSSDIISELRLNPGV